MSDTEKQRNVLTAKQTFEVGKFLEDKLVPALAEGDEPRFKYEDDYSDAKIGAELGIEKNLIASVRERLFGKLAAPPKAEKAATPRSRGKTADLEARILELEKAVDALAKRVVGIEDELDAEAQAINGAAHADA